jgi:hypothetical protein
VIFIGALGQVFGFSSRMMKKNVRLVEPDFHLALPIRMSLLSRLFLRFTDLKAS